MSSTCSYNCLDDLVDEAELVARIITSRWTTSASNGSIFEADKDIDSGAPRAAATSGAVEVTGGHGHCMAELVDVLATLSRHVDGGNQGRGGRPCVDARAAATPKAYDAQSSFC